MGVGVWMGVGHPCPPVCNDIVTPRHFHVFLQGLSTLNGGIFVGDGLLEWFVERGWWQVVGGEWLVKNGWWRVIGEEWSIGSGQ